MGKHLITMLAALTLLAAACGGADAGTDTTAGGADPGNGEEGLACASLLSLEEAAALFGEPAVFDAEASDEERGSGTVSCVWSSVEDPEDLEDLQVHLLQVQVYRGAEYYNPELTYDEVEDIAGIGDEAFFSPQLGAGTGFRDGDVVGFVTYSVIGMGDAPESIAKKDQVIELLRVVHDRVV